MGLAALVCLTLFLHGSWALTSPDSCSCGWSAQCSGGNCSCPAELVLHSDGRNCRNASCTDAGCLQCDQPDHCIRCAVFISQSSGSCSNLCAGLAELQGDNLVCTENEEENTKVNIIIAVFAGAGAGLFICCMFFGIFCLCLRKKRKNINLQTKNYADRQMETGNIKQFSMYDNSGFEPESPTFSGAGKIDPLDYVSELDRLRLHTESLMTLLGQLRAKAKAMSPNDPRVPTYKAMIHRLLRVLALLHKKDPVVSIPSDAMSLIQWAYQMLEDSREQQISASDIDGHDVVIAQISSVDVDSLDAVSPVYMTPESSHMELPLTSGKPLNSNMPLNSAVPVTSPYSTCQVPQTSEKQQLTNTLGRKSGFATINRATSVTNAALLSSIEADEKKFGIHSENTGTQPASPPSSSGFSLEDLQIFLINAPVASTLGNQPDIISGYNTLPNLGKRNASNKTNRHSFSKDKVEANGSIYSNPQKLNMFNPVQPPATQKKNIITNAKTASLGRKAGANYSVPSIGYFANGHYYDPNPMPIVEPEIYAPGSTYSDRSNVMSTFLGDLPHSISSSDESDFGDNLSENNSGGDLEVFPFDLKDATEPVEV
ncbi:uncharacterized protein LOC106052551 [Biomphalaria glabrata]|uniref:Uncharacterized protein LOC106052551 n=1 Tax=Biomphalaria glabrata TaxID=6526 RepID=A0A9W2ZK96_BIOGL|nr:uncharacterized protein LOC106052551 [Biomphalaria glabrata]XP_013063407.2 uncharacterized protein LOC106052551 [Biomphalaria glabrata]XP_055875414.1 uncharacterized protein LOC106052551 [Biomphalaria glabrata]XP_055875415.1 uncharacterized protein LOC106052551 [Biomphalaria glabrata]